MKQIEHAARNLLIETGNALPGIWEAFMLARAAHVFPAGVFVDDVCAGEALVAAGKAWGGAAFIDMAKKWPQADAAQRVSTFATLASWRMSQGIYRFDPALYGPLVDTPFDGSIPADVLLRLPQWCVYIETPGMTMPRKTGGNTPIHGVFARLDSDLQHRFSLAMAFVVEHEGALWMVHQNVPLQGTLSTSISSVFAEWGIDDPHGVAVVKAYTAPVLNLLLYLCAEGAEIDGKRGQPGNPAPRKTRRDGLKLFAADGPATWDVGVRIGAALRRAYQSSETAQGGTHAGPRPHIRRAHWHGFRSGPRLRPDGSEIPAALRKFDLRWLPPIPVNLTDAGELPATIKPVKG